MSSFLEINMNRGTEGKVILTQIWLIDRILSVTDMEECNHKYTPADKIPLDEDEYGDPLREDWKYWLVGMLLYLAGSSRLGIAYDVHQCAMFSHNLKHSYEIGTKRFIRYLKVTKDKELILFLDTKKI